MGSVSGRHDRLRRVVSFVAIANLVYFIVEFIVAQQISSVSLLADSVDFLEDASVNLLIVMAMGWSAAIRVRVGMLMSLLLLFPAAAALWTAWEKFNNPEAPPGIVMSITALGALVVNLICALVLARHQREAGSLTKAAFLSARNDSLANFAVIIAGLVTMVWLSGWPDLLVGITIATLNLDAAKQVWTEARTERSSFGKSS